MPGVASIVEFHNLMNDAVMSIKSGMYLSVFSDLWRVGNQLSVRNIRLCWNFRTKQKEKK